MKRVSIVLMGSRKANKRIALFTEGLRKAGFRTILGALPRGQWDFSPFENNPPESHGVCISKWDTEGVEIPSVVICFHWVLLPIAVLFRLIGARVIYDEHDDYELNSREGRGLSRHFSPMLVKLFHTIFLPFVNAITCIHLKNHALKAKLQRFNGTVIEIHNYPDAGWRASDAKRDDYPLCVVYVGGIWKVKGCELLARSCVRANQRGASVECHFFGGGMPSLSKRLRRPPE